MQSLVPLCALLLFLFSVHADVVGRFEVSELSLFIGHTFVSMRVCCVGDSIRALSHCVILTQDEPECMKYFYKEKVPELGASTPGAARLCHRFVNR